MGVDAAVPAAHLQEGGEDVEHAVAQHIFLKGVAARFPQMADVGDSGELAPTLAQHMEGEHDHDVELVLALKGSFALSNI